MGKYPSPTKGTSPDAQKHMSGGKWARVLKCLPGQTGSSLDPHLFLDRVASKAALETGFDVPYGLSAGGSLLGVTRRSHRHAWPLSVPGLALWVDSITFDGLYEAVIFQGSETEVPRPKTAT